MFFHRKQACGGNVRKQRKIGNAVNYGPGSINLVTYVYVDWLAQLVARQLQNASLAASKARVAEGFSTLPLSLETLSIVHAMLPQVEAQQASLTLRMWHHLSEAPDREALFTAFSGDGEQSLLQSFLAALNQRVRTRWPRMKPAAGLREAHGPMLEEAFGRAFNDLLGNRGNPVVLNAWTQTFHDFWVELCLPPATSDS